MEAPPALEPGQRRQRYWRSERIWFDGDAYWDGVLADIAAAKHSVDFETYIFADDVLGARVSGALMAAADRGVHVRLLVDGVGAGAWVKRRAPELQRRQLSVRVFHPLPWLLGARAYGGASRIARMFRMLLRVNRRDHRKVCVVDRRLAWVGSFNVSSDHLASVRGGDCWRDTGARVEGVAVHELVDAFAYTWRRSWRLTRTQLNPPLLWKNHKPEGNSGLVRLNHKLAGRRKMYDELIHRIANARRRVWISAAYFVPSKNLVEALSQAARNGVDVRLLMPAKSDVLFMPWVSSAFYRALLTPGVRIYEFQPRILHAKTLLIDDWLTVGSTNLNSRSLLHDLEAEVVLLHPRTHRLMERAFLADLESSCEVVLDDWRRRPWLQKWCGRIALRARYWL